MFDNLFKTKKGIGGLSDNAIQFVVVAVTIGIGATILGNIATAQGLGLAGCNATNASGCSAAVNASVAGGTAMNTFSSNLNTLSLVVIFGVILFFLGRFLVTRQE